MPIPSFTEFDPKIIKWQHEAHLEIFHFDYNLGALECFFSGGVGSAKTSEHIHELVADMVEQPNSVAIMLRRTLKDLKRTSWKELLQHMRDIPHLIASYNKTEMTIKFINGSIIMGDSYDDGDETKYQSLNLSHVDIEEGNEMPQNVYNAIKLRVGRAGVLKNRIQIRCNPDSPSHWLHKYFIEDEDHPNKLVCYSLTEHNPTLPRWYIENLKRDLDPKMAQRKLYGKWIEISDDMVYHNYDSARNFKKNETYVYDLRYPISFMHDFNIGNGKPMSAAVGQHIEGVFHVANKFIVEGMSTPRLMEEIADSGLLEHKTKFLIYGDSSGGNGDTRKNQSDYEIIEEFFSKFKRKDDSRLDFELNIPLKNPPIRTRHNVMNALFLNEAGDVRFYVYKEAKEVDEGFRLTKFKSGSKLIEDDTFRLQHVTTACGYWGWYVRTYGDTPSKVTMN